MKIKSLINLLDAKEVKKYFIVVNDKKEGPFSLNDLISQEYSGDKLVWSKGFSRWVELKSIAGYTKNVPPEIPKDIKNPKEKDNIVVSKDTQGYKSEENHSKIEIILDDETLKFYMQKSTKELTEILNKHDTTTYKDETFDIIRYILNQRNIKFNEELSKDYKTVMTSSEKQKIEEKKNKRLSTSSIILGILGGYPYAFPASISAILLGVVSIKKIKKEPEKYGGYTEAIIGIILGIVGFVLSIILAILNYQLGLIVKSL